MSSRRTWLIGAASLGAATAAQALRPSKRAADLLEPIKLEIQIPKEFSSWQIDPSIVPVVPNPEVQAKLESIYNQTLARTYVNDAGERVMLSIAYGSDQGTDATAAHRPEFCYTSQGFKVGESREVRQVLSDRSLMVRQLVARFQGRTEPITYWVTLNDTAVLPGIERKLNQIRMGLSGLIPDGLLFRVSTIGDDIPAGFAIQATFLAGLARSMPTSTANRYFGRS
jgi:EpsI family protein